MKTLVIVVKEKMADEVYNEMLKTYEKEEIFCRVLRETMATKRPFGHDYCGVEGSISVSFENTEQPEGEKGK